MLQQVFYLDVAYVSHTCYKLYVRNVPSALVICCIQVFHVSEVESPVGHGLGAGGRDAARRGPTVGTRSAPRIMQTMRARPHAGSWVSPTQR
jgi:hypothetical protein